MCPDIFAHGWPLGGIEFILQDAKSQRQSNALGRFSLMIVRRIHKFFPIIVVRAFSGEQADPIIGERGAAHKAASYKNSHFWERTAGKTAINSTKGNLI